jgi:CRP-like cAMP-binding protein
MSATPCPPPMAVPSIAALMRRVSALAQLSPIETLVLEHLAGRQQQHIMRAELCAEGEIPKPRIMVSGWACRQRVMNDGRRQIISFMLPGDTIGPLRQSPLPESCATVALTPVVTVDAQALLQAACVEHMQHPGLSMAVRCMASQQERWLRDQVVRLGRRSAYERTIHLVLELHGRLDAIGLAPSRCFAFPLTQDVLADALGLSVVHVNRVLAQARRDGLFELHGGHIVIHQLECMEATAPDPSVHPPRALGS